MSSAPTPSRRDDPWHRMVRCLVMLFVASLERRIARLLADMEALPEDPRFDAEFARLDARCAYFEDLRDAYRAWLDDPEAPTLRGRCVNVIVWRRRPLLPRPRLAGARALGGRLAWVARGGGRCTTTSAMTLDRPAGRAGAAVNRVL